MNCTYKGVGRWEGGGAGGEGGGGGWGGWRGRVGSRRLVIPSNWTVWSSYESKKC